MNALKILFAQGKLLSLTVDKFKDFDNVDKVTVSFERNSVVVSLSGDVSTVSALVQKFQKES